ncbi:ABC transporter ATP-binding protein [Paenibacillus albicereus]|uniref:ABC transporter ATP-binding protein n=1 Tax=Paenibacillus albicereus TaxID=2726185 RepID=A0A6H2H2T1_9BACL|nr:ABC transporter ATP-binding protein [Paenibacillus albicereus]QJC53967.1 ABC transporter ATP-binding protein [Paenibacillus albicereus]
MAIQHPSAATSPVPAAELRGVARRFGGKEALSGLSLVVPRGILLGLLGPSGSGKTTLVKLLTGLDRADEGEAFVLGERMPRLSVLGRVGYMAQSDALYGELTARDNLVFFGGLYGLSGKRLQERMEAVMSLVDLQAHLRKPVAAYSGGMKRRLSLAISLLHEPELLLLDEPTVGIDPVLRQSIWRELLRLRERGMTILLTTHVMDEAERCDSLAFIREGRMTASGTPAELMQRSGAQTIEQAFIVLGGGATA